MAEFRSAIERSFSMLVASYYLSRCGVSLEGKSSLPPLRLGVSSWKDAYDVFFQAMGDGRQPAQFRNSLKNARDTYDVLFENGRIGWVASGGNRPSMSPSFRRVHDEWEARSNEELEDFIFVLLSGFANAPRDQLAGSVAKTEGGKEVFISTRPERDGSLKKAAIAIHGLACSACGFDFEEVYGALGQGFVEVHHVVPLAQSGRTETNPATDLAVLCSNCHRMVHRQQGVCLTIGELKLHLQASSRSSRVRPVKATDSV